MIAALRYELVRIRTIRSSYWMSGLALVLTAALSLILILAINSAAPTDMTLPEVTTWVLTGGASAFGVPVLAAVFFAVLGAMAMGHEYRYGTNKTTLSAIPDRVAVLLAKALVLVVWVVVSTVAILLVNLLLAELFLHQAHFSASSSLRPMANYVGYCVGFALAGLSLSTVFRNQTGAIVMVLVWPLVIEVIALTVMRAVTINTDVDLSLIYNLLPASAGRRSIFSPYDLFAQLDFDRANIWGLEASMLVFWVAILGLFGLASVLFVRRDA